MVNEVVVGMAVAGEMIGEVEEEEEDVGVEARQVQRTGASHSVLNQGFLYTNLDFFYKTSQTVLLVLTFLDMMFEQEAVPVS